MSTTITAPPLALPVEAACEVRRCSACRAKLSRYNKDTLCGGCARARSGGDVRLRPAIVNALWAQGAVQSALAARDFGTLCRLLREGSTLNQQDMAELTGLSQAFLSMLEGGVRRLTNIDKIAVMLDGLGTPDELIAVVVRGRLPGPS